MERVLITGIAGQVGSYLAEMFLAEGHAVVGLASGADRPLPAAVERARGSLAPAGIEELLDGNGPLTAIVHLASVTSMVQSWEQPHLTFDLNGRAGVELAFALARRPTLRLVHASSAEIFGRAREAVQDESTPIDPVSPYGIAKAAAHMAVRLVRQTHGAPASNLILYMTESPRRRPTFVMRRITRSVAAIVCGDAEEIVLGNTEAVRDFVHARDVAAAAKLLAKGAPAGDYVCASGKGHSIHQLAEAVCRVAGLDPKGRIRSDAALYRPNDIPSLVGDPRALRARGWEPRSSFEELLAEVFEHDLRAYRAGR
ncbi:MAG: GDP-mannose 4,6-dehydratase [Myxococcota bacterium]|nr:GDP-mannose 4,6-dehydratase [Myxococcota bacterium]